MKPRGYSILFPILLVGALLVVCLNTWFALRSVDVLLASEDWVQHTWQVLTEVEQIMSLAKDAGAGNLHYLLTGDEAFAEPYRSARQLMPRGLDDLQRLTADNPKQLANVGELRAAMQDRFLQIESTIMLGRGGGLKPHEAMLANEGGKLQLDRLRAIGDAMEHEEHRLLAIRLGQTRRSTRSARETIGLASLLDLCLIVFMARYIVRERELRLVTEQVAANLAASRAEVEANALEVQALNKTLEERVRLRTAELETTNRELEAFSYSVSHDLRAPLRTIDGFSLALEEDYAAAVGVTGKDYIKRVRSGVQRMGELIDALLQLSRITRAAIQREHVDMSAMAHTVADDLLEQNPGREIEFKIEHGLEAEADPALLRVALENLFGNAVKFSSKVPKAVIEFGWDKEQNAWFLRDNGAGFDMYYAEKLFNAFNRLHGDKDFKGSGIGLATVARVIRRHHGTIWADSVVDHGATFLFTLR